MTLQEEVDTISKEIDKLILQKRTKIAAILSLKTELVSNIIVLCPGQWSVNLITCYFFYERV